MSREYDNYIIDHVSNVKEAYFWLKERKIISEELFDQISIHDLSKYTDSEYDAYDAYFYGKKLRRFKKTSIMLGYITFTQTHIIGNIGF